VLKKRKDSSVVGSSQPKEKAGVGQLHRAN